MECCLLPLLKENGYNGTRNYLYTFNVRTFTRKVVLNNLKITGEQKASFRQRQRP